MASFNIIYQTEARTNMLKEADEIFLKKKLID